MAGTISSFSPTTTSAGTKILLLSMELVNSFISGMNPATRIANPIRISGNIAIAMAAIPAPCENPRMPSNGPSSLTTREIRSSEACTSVHIRRGSLSGTRFHHALPESNSVAACGAVMK
ncbi:hypothetical protein GGI06_000121 [Coemansia sp. S85]|nr:hypothetical protein GGI06_000121 [Coemansia sp. S85]